MGKEEVLLVYDKQCPVCHGYCQLVQIRDGGANLRLVDARESSEVMDEITAKGLDIDQGMVLKKGGQVFYGADAIHELALMSRQSNAFSRLNHWTFKSKRVSGVIYPILRGCRNLILKALRKSKINNLEHEGNARF